MAIKMKKLFKKLWKIELKLRKATLMFPLVRHIRSRLRRLSKKTIYATLTVFVLVSGMGIWSLLSPKAAQAAWWNESWYYRNTLSVTNNTTAENNVYISFTLDTATLVTAGKLQADCDDLRFTKENGEVLPHFIVSGCNTGTTTIHVFFDTFPAGVQTLYYYYGNPNAVSGAASADFSTAASNYTIGSTGTESKGPSPVAYWRLDDGSGTTAQDSSINNNDMTTITGATWKTDDMCVSGKCLYFDLADNVAQRAETASLDFGTSSDSNTVSAWIRTAVTTFPDTAMIIAKYSGSGAFPYNLALDNTGLPCYQVSDGTHQPFACGTSTINDGKWHHIEGTRDVTADTVNVYVDGKLVGSANDTTTATTANNADVSIGNGGTSYTQYDFSGFIDDVKVYNYARTTSQIKTDYNGKGNSEGTSLNLSSNTQNNPNALSNGLTGYWKMNGTTTGNSLPDSSGNGKTLGDNGSISYSAGKFGPAPTFNGSSKYFNVNPNIYTFINYKSIFGNATVDKPTGTAANDLLILLCGSNAGTTFSPPSGFSSINSVENAGQLKEEMFYKIATSSEPSTYTCGNAYQTQILTYRNANGFTTDLSDDGASLTGTTMTAPSINTTAANDLVVRVFATWVSNTISSAPATQRMNEFDGGGDAVYVSDEFKSTAGATGTSTADQDNSGPWVTFTAAFKPTSALSSTISGVKTVAFWVKPGSTTDNFVNLASGIYINASSGTISATGWTNPTIYVNGVQSSTITSGTWQHVVVTSNTGISADAFEVGRANGSYAANNTQMAEVRTYNRTLLTNDITTLYNWAPGAKAYYKFDEGTGTTTADSSGNGYNGTFYGSGSAGPDWTVGKVGKGLAFDRDGTNKAVYAVDPMPTTDFTYSFWTQLQGTTNERILLRANGNAAGNPDHEFGITSRPNFVRTLDVELNGSTVLTSNTSLTLNQWYYVTVTRSGSTVNLYLNGVLDSTGTDGTALTFDPSCYLLMGIEQSFGTCSGTTFASEYMGKLDDLKIYDYGRTLAQITSDMNSGHPNVGSPIASAFGHWKMDEGTDNTCSGGTNDACNSGNG